MAGCHAAEPQDPALCYSPQPDLRPDGNCRACMVEVEGERVLAASAAHAERRLKVKSAARARSRRRRW
jgi:formate dehydrogenase major subunit